MSDYSLLGLAIAVAGIAVILFAVVSSARREGDDKDDKARVRGAGVVMVGPIPIIFGTDVKWTVVAVILAIVLLVLGLLTTFR
jgi:uncharacterized protein (TIGR00304 family)